MYSEVHSCRLCGVGSLVPVLDFGEQYVVDFVKKPDDNLLKAPLLLVRCDNCGLVQLKHSVDRERLYKKFWYKSSTNESMREALEDVVLTASKVVYVAEGDTVLDIGCNDGELLGNYVGGVKTVGIDPCADLVEEGIRKYRINIGIKEFFSYSAVAPHGPYKVITAIAMFYDLEDPVGFLNDCKAVLRQDGVIVVQMNYLGTMISNFAVDNICHEHLTYFSMETFRRCAEAAGLEVCGASQNKVNGGSFRVFLTHKNSGLYGITNDSQVNLFTNSLAMLYEERKNNINSPETYIEFGKAVMDKCAALQKYITTEAERGEKIYLYGASTRGTVLLQMLNLSDGVVQAVAERDISKLGLHMVGASWPKICTEEEARSKATQMLLLPWHYLDAVWKREEDWLRKGGKMIVPLPEPRVLTWDGKSRTISTVKDREVVA